MERWDGVKRGQPEAELEDKGDPTSTSGASYVARRHAVLNVIG